MQTWHIPALALVTLCGQASAAKLTSLDSEPKKQVYCNVMAKMAQTLAIARDKGKTKLEAAKILAQLEKDLAYRLLEPMFDELDMIYSPARPAPEQVGQRTLYACGERLGLDPSDIVRGEKAAPDVGKR